MSLSYPSIPMHLLLAEDDLLLGDGLRAGLGQLGFEVVWVRDGREALRALHRGGFDAVVLDLGLPSMDGMEVLAALRAAGGSVPVLVLTARDAVPDRIRGLDAGADDYVLKPVDLHELSARLHALRRRCSGLPPEHLTAQGLTLDPATRVVMQAGQVVVLSVREFDLLHVLMLNTGHALSRDQLEQHLYSWGQQVDSNAVEVHVHYLRRKLGSGVIQTVRGVGYLLPRETPWSSPC